MKRLLFVNQVAPYPDGPAGVHGVLGQAATALGELARLAGLEPTVTSDVSTVAPEELSADVVALFNIGETPWSADQRRVLVDSVTTGRTAVLGLHSSTDACRAWDEYGPLLGARFDGHPWTQSFPIDVVEKDHPATVGLPHPWPWHDEVYLFTNPRPDARVLLSVDPSNLDMTVRNARVPAWGIPLAWCHQHGAGRVFYSAIGHFPLAWETPVYLRYLSGALDWLLGA